MCILFEMRLLLKAAECIASDHQHSSADHRYQNNTRRGEGASNYHVSAVGLLHVIVTEYLLN